VAEIRDKRPGPDGEFRREPVDCVVVGELVALLPGKSVLPATIDVAVIRE
jgi:hypothetical protein